MKRELMLWGAVISLTLGIAFPSSASEWNFYGSARVGTFYRTKETATSDRGYYTHSLYSTARIGANVKVSDSLVGRFEHGTYQDTANLRHLYGEWDFGPGKLLVGQTDTPLNFSLSKQAVNNDSIMNAYGHVDGKRKPMLQLTFGNLKIAAVQPETDDLGLASSAEEVKFPKIEAKYRFAMDWGYFELAGGYQDYELTDTAASRKYDVTSYIMAAGGQVRAGAFYINADAWVGQNVGPYEYSFDPDGDPDISGTTLTDNEAWGMLFVLGYKLNDMFAFEAGFGHVQSELDGAVAGKEGTDKSETYYIQSTITLAPGVFIVPEIGRIHKFKDFAGVPVEDTHYAGAKWQINF